MIADKIYIIKHSFIVKLLSHTFNFFEYFCAPLLLLFIRLWMARIFWHSGLGKISSWPETLALFQNQYNVPFLPSELVAYLTTMTELSCPILLLFGFATRLAAIPMLLMTAVIQLTYMSGGENLYWAVLLMTLICFGPGAISLDWVVKKMINWRGNRF